MGAPYQDGVYPTGAPILTTTGGFTYKCNKISLDKSADTVNITDPDGAHAGAVQFAGPVTGTCELQFANSTVPEPNVAVINANTGVFLVNVNSVNINAFFTHVALERPQRGPWIASCQFQVRQN